MAIIKPNILYGDDVPRIIHGIKYPDGPKPKYEDKFSGPCIVCGTAPGWQKELAKAREAFQDAHLVAVNFAGADESIPWDWWVSYHPDVFWGKGRVVSPETHSDKPVDGVDVRWHIGVGGGSSSLLAVTFARLAGFSPIITAGVHLVDRYKHMSGRWHSFRDALTGHLFSVSPEGTYVRDKFGGINGIRC
jgi:hypothetical protein